MIIFDRSFKELIIIFTNSIVYKVIGYFIGVAILIFYFYISVNDLQMIYIVHLIASTCLVFFIIAPTLKLISNLSKDNTIVFSEISSLILKSVLLVFIFGNVYYIVLSGERVLYLNYKLVGFSILVFIILGEYRVIRNSIDKEGKKKIFWIISKRILLFIISLGLFFLTSEELFLNQKIVQLSKLEEPRLISIRKYDEKISYNNISSFISANRAEIKEKKIIYDLIKQLHNKELENLRGISYIDYVIKSTGEYPYYWLYFDYNPLNSKNRDSEIFYIDSIILYDSGKMIIREYNREIKEIQRYETYISKELTDKIISYVH